MTNATKAPPGKFIVKSFAASGAPPAVETFETIEAARERAGKLNSSEDWAVEGIFDENGNKL